MRSLTRHVGAGSNISRPADQGYGPPAARRGGAACQRGQAGQGMVPSGETVAEDRGGNGREPSFCWLPVKEHGRTASGQAPERHRKDW